jgi:hypothetical protein
MSTYTACLLFVSSFLMLQLVNEGNFERALRWLKKVNCFSSYDRILFIVNVCQSGQKGLHWTVLEVNLGKIDGSKVCVCVCVCVCVRESVCVCVCH